MMFCAILEKNTKKELLETLVSKKANIFDVFKEQDERNFLEIAFSTQSNQNLEFLLKQTRNKLNNWSYLHNYLINPNLDIQILKQIVLENKMKNMQEGMIHRSNFFFYR